MTRIGSMVGRTVMASMLAVGLSSAQAADEVKIGMITTLSGPASGLGIDIRDGFALALADLGGNLGGLPASVVEADDQLKPDVAVDAARAMVERDEVDFVTGVVFSNVALAIAPTVFRSETFFVSPNAGPSPLAGRQCNPFFFNVAWQNDNNHEAMGQHVSDAGLGTAFILAPNYPAGKDALAGFKRFYNGEVVAELYTQLGQLDYAAELAQIRAADPDAVYFFLPGGMGINFIKQYAQAGLKDTVPLFGPAFSFSQDILPAVGDAALGIMNTAQWAGDIDTPQNKAFVAAFQEAYGRLPSLYASQGYDAAMLIDSAVTAVGGDLDDKDALRAALKAADFTPLAGGNFGFNSNHFPIRDYYLREIVSLGDGNLTNRTISRVFENHADAYAGECSM